MLIFSNAKLVLFAMPKSGSTAYHMALRRVADIALVNKTGIKHTRVSTYHQYIAPFLEGAYGLVPETVAVMREPVEYMRSWYRYRQRPKLRGQPNSTEGVSFDDFLVESLSKDAAPFARIGLQSSFLDAKGGIPAVNHLFAYERIDDFHQFLEIRLGFEFATKPFNTSPEVDTKASEDVLTIYRNAQSDEFKLYQHLMTANGHLEAPGKR